MENTTAAWGSAALLAVAIGGPFDQATNATAADAINTDAMLDVSVSIRTISHVSIDRFGDSVWAPGSGSGLLVSTRTCEVWTNHHVIEDAAVIEILPRGWDAVHGIPARVINSSPRASSGMGTRTVVGSTSPSKSRIRLRAARTPVGRMSVWG